jgi:hypothetical protein
MLLDTLPAPSTNGVDKVYHKLKEILGVVTEQQAESSLTRWAEVSVSSQVRSKASRQRTASEVPLAGTVSSLARDPTYLRPGHLTGHPENPACHQASRGGEEGAHSEHHMHNLCYGKRGDRERCSLSPKGSGPKAFGSNVCDACFPKRFPTPNNIIKYDDKTNPSVWREDYGLACRVGGVDDDLFIIQFLPIYLVDTARAWLDHLPRNLIDCWEDLKEFFTGNFQGTYVWPGNPWDLKDCRQKQGESLRDYI